MRPSHHALRPLALTLFLAGSLASASHAAPDGASRIVIAGNDAAPDLAPGVTLRSISRGTFRFVQFDDLGQVSFGAELAGTGVTGANNQAYWQGGRLVVRTGTPLPGLPSGVTAARLDRAAGSTYLAQLTGTGVTTSNGSGLWSQGALLLRTGSATAYELNRATVNGTARSISLLSTQGAPLIYQLEVQDNGPALQGPTGATLLTRPSLWMNGKLMALGGSAAPGARGVFNGFGTVATNSAGQAVFAASHDGRGFRSAIRQGIWRDDLSSVVLSGEQPTGMTGSEFMGLFTPRLSTTAQVAFAADIGTPDGAGRNTVRRSIWRDRELLALEGQQVTVANGKATVQTLEMHEITGSGAVFYGAALQDASGTQTSSLWRDNTLQVQTGQAARAKGLEGMTYSSVSFAGATQAGTGNLLAWVSNLNGGSSQAIVLSDGRDEVLVSRTGDTVGRLQVASFVDIASTTGSVQINSQGQVLYGANSTAGNDVLTIFTPTLHWRGASAGKWDDLGTWTLGLTPGAVHDVVLDTAGPLTLAGPAGRVTLNSLAIGTGGGMATLNMAGGRIDAGSVLVGTQGVLSGTGSFGAQVTNQGLLQAERLVITGGLLNAGTVRGATGNGSRLDAALTNKAGARVRVGLGETLQLGGTSTTNAGTFEINGGRLELTSDLTNQRNGVIDLKNATVVSGAMLRNEAGSRLMLNEARLTTTNLLNQGQVLVTSGSSEVFGSVSNVAGGQILLSGQGTTTFYDAVEINGGSELRVSAGATAVFFGAVAQRSGALMTGTGHKYFEGGLSVGNSPGLGEDAGSVSFGLGSTYLAEIGGTALGTTYDHYRVAGTLTLGGTLRLVSFAGFTGQAGQSFDLFDWGQVQGQFSQIDSSGLQLAAGTTLDVSRLYTDGVIGVTAVPEPGTWALMLSGIGLLALRRRPR